MLRFFALRLLRAFVTIVLVVTFAFVVLRLSGDPALIILGPESAPEAIAAFRKSWGLDEPLWRQYFSYFGAIAQGELGRSMRDGRSAIELVAERIPATLALTIPAISCSVVIAGMSASAHCSRMSFSARFSSLVKGGSIASSCADTADAPSSMASKIFFIVIPK